MILPCFTTQKTKLAVGRLRYSSHRFHKFCSPQNKSFSSEIIFSSFKLFHYLSLYKIANFFAILKQWILKYHEWQWKSRAYLITVYSEECSHKRTCFNLNRLSPLVVRWKPVWDQWSGNPEPWDHLGGNTIIVVQFNQALIDDLEVTFYKIWSRRVYPSASLSSCSINPVFMYTYKCKLHSRIRWLTHSATHHFFSVLVSPRNLYVGALYGVDDVQ